MPQEMTPVQVRSKLVDALRLDLVGPSGQLGNPAEVLPQAPSRWYLTGFLVPIEAESSQRTDEAGTEGVDEAGGPGGLDDDVVPEPAAARQRYLPSSAGLSVLVPKDARHLRVGVTWGDYHLRSEASQEWLRTARCGNVAIDLSKTSGKAKEVEVPGSAGLRVAASPGQSAVYRPKPGCRMAPARFPCLWSIAGQRRRTSGKMRRSPSRCNLISNATRASCPGRTSAA